MSLGRRCFARWFLVLAGAALGCAWPFAVSAQTGIYSKTQIEKLKKDARADAAAQYALGFCYAVGDGVPASMRDAVSWYAKAAAQGHAEAQFKYAYCLENGLGGGKPNPYAAFEWYKKAAEQGLPDAQFALAECYNQGRGVDTNVREKFRWYRAAAEQGHAAAQYQLAVCFHLSHGVPRDARQALVWAAIAAAQGDPGGTKLRDVLLSKIYDSDFRSVRREEALEEAARFVPRKL